MAAWAMGIALTAPNLTDWFLENRRRIYQWNLVVLCSLIPVSLGFYELENYSRITKGDALMIDVHASTGTSECAVRGCQAVKL
jgi:hypothetical protein